MVLEFLMAFVFVFPEMHFTDILVVKYNWILPLEFSFKDNNQTFIGIFRHFKNISNVMLIRCVEYLYSFWKKKAKFNAHEADRKTGDNHLSMSFKENSHKKLGRCPPLEINFRNIRMLVL